MAKVHSCGIFLVNNDNKLLIGHPTNHKPDFWSIPKGKVEEGETYLQAAIRETFEETNIDLSMCKGFRELDMVNYSHNKKALHPFLVLERNNSVVNWSSFDIKCNSCVPVEKGGFPEMDSFLWVSLDEARVLLHKTQVKCLDKIKELINGNN